MLLSICIPTYNRPEFLREALESIVLQINASNKDQCEIVISDNASAENPVKMIERIKEFCPCEIKYFRNEENVGFDKNCLLAVERAGGDYCWLLGDDDKLSPGALEIVLRQILASPRVDLFMGEKEDYNADFSHKMKRRPIFNSREELFFDFKKQNIDSYFKASKKLICFFNFISIVVFKRERWLSVRGKDAFAESGYIHLYVFMSILWGEEMGSFRYLPRSIAQRRWGTDMSRAFDKRLKMDVSGFHSIAKAVFCDPRHVRMLDRLVIKNDAFSWAVRAKMSCGAAFYFDVFPFLFRYYWSFPLFWLKMAPLLFTPAFVLRIMRSGYRVFVKGEKLSPGDFFCGQ